MRTRKTSLTPIWGAAGVVPGSQCQGCNAGDVRRSPLYAKGASANLRSRCDRHVQAGERHSARCLGAAWHCEHLALPMARCPASTAGSASLWTRENSHPLVPAILLRKPLNAALGRFHAGKRWRICKRGDSAPDARPQQQQAPYFTQAKHPGTVRASLKAHRAACVRGCGRRSPRHAPRIECTAPTLARTLDGAPKHANRSCRL